MPPSCSWHLFPEVWGGVSHMRGRSPDNAHPSRSLLGAEKETVWGHNFGWLFPGALCLQDPVQIKAKMSADIVWVPLYLNGGLGRRSVYAQRESPDSATEASWDGRGWVFRGRLAWALWSFRKGLNLGALWFPICKVGIIITTKQGY